MKRRNFLKMAGATTACAAVPSTLQGADQPPIPNAQHRPLPDVGSHWETFAKLSQRCRADLSFLRPQFEDPESWAKEARSALEADLHYDPPLCDPEPELVERADAGSHVRERLMISTTPDIRIPVYVLIPKNLRRPAPGIVALHDHGGFYYWGKEKVVRVPPEHPELAAFKKRAYGGQSIADALARRGYVVLAADMLHWGERGLYLHDDPPRIRDRTAAVTSEDIKQFNARSWAHEELIGRTAFVCGATWSGIIVRDDMRLTDYLMSREEVDAERVGCVGLSVGAVRTIFLGALHDAIRASVAVCWMAKYQPMARGHVRYGIGFTKIVPGLYAKLDWPDLAGLHWPGALMTINGRQDRLYPLEAAQAAVDKIGRIFDKMGDARRYAGVFFDGPHEFNQSMQQRAFQWLDNHLEVPS